jgi:hypothetical protein
MLLHVDYNSQRVDMSLQVDTLFWLWVNQSLLLLLKAAYATEKQQITIYGLD